MKTVAVKSDRPGGLLKASEGLFLLYVFLLPFSLFLGFPFGGARLQITDVVFVMSALFWLVALASRSANFRVSPLYVFIGLYLGAMSVSAALSTDARLSLIKLLGVYYLAAVAVLTFNLCQRNGFARRALLCFLIGAAVTGIGTIVAVVGFYSGWESTRPMLSHYGSLPVGNYPRVRSVFENANMASNYLNVAAAAIVAGQPLSSAAAAAGFVDAAHMTRTFKRMFGVSPSELRRAADQPPG